MLALNSIQIAVYNLLQRDVSLIVQIVATIAVAMLFVSVVTRLWIRWFKNGLWCQKAVT